MTEHSDPATAAESQDPHLTVLQGTTTDQRAQCHQLPAKQGPDD
jgi:hypothetical protein